MADDKVITFWHRFCAAVDAGLLGESPTAVKAYGAMSRESDYQGRVEIGFEQIASHLHRVDERGNVDRDTRRQIKEAVESLAHRGYISVIAEGHGRGRKGIYQLVHMRGGADLLSGQGGGTEARSLPPHGTDAVGKDKGGNYPPFYNVPASDEKGGNYPTVSVDKGGKKPTEVGKKSPLLRPPPTPTPVLTSTPPLPGSGVGNGRGVGLGGDWARAAASSLSASRSPSAVRVASPQQLELFVQENAEVASKAPELLRQRMLTMVGVQASQEFVKRADLTPPKFIAIWKGVWSDVSVLDKSAVMVSRLRGPRPGQFRHRSRR